ncbi:MAG: FeoA domain-containing protein [Bacteroidota bacterium]
MSSLTTTLNEIPAGRLVRIHRLQSQPDICFRLREMGFCENAIVRLVVNGEGNLICEVCNTRIGLNHALADDIIVAPFE